MNALVINQVEQEGVRETYPVFQVIARRRQAIRRALSKITVPAAYRQELKMGRRVAQAIDRHQKLSNAILWIMAFVFVFEVFMKG